MELSQDACLWVLHPGLAADEPYNSRVDINEYSVVILLEYKQFRALFTGDIGESTETRLCERYDRWDVDLLKVPHNGSRYSSSSRFLAEISPAYAVISLGRNPYNPPNEESYDRLYAVQAQVLRTDYDGTVRVQTYGDGYRLYTTRSNRLYIHPK